MIGIGSIVKFEDGTLITRQGNISSTVERMDSQEREKNHDNNNGMKRERLDTHYTI